MTEKHMNFGMQSLESEFGTLTVKKAIENVRNFKVEIPSWIFGRFGGGRFGDYMPPGAARNVREKLDDAAIVHKLTGATDTVAMHILWDFSRDGKEGDIAVAEEVAKESRSRGMKIGAINPTYFLKGSERGSLSATEKQTVQRYINQTILAGTIAGKFGNKLITLWLPDGSLYPGQVELKKAQEILFDSLQDIRQKIDKDVTILIEYKVFEPGTYSTVLSDWGSAYMAAMKMGDNAGVLVDLGHHHHGTNIEQIVARLICSGMKCGFHFNTRYAADDDHAVEPNGEIARIFYELVTGDVIFNQNSQKNWAFMIDQCSSRENRIHAILHTVDSLQIALARASLVDPARLEEFQKNDEIILANRFFNNAILNADVRPILFAVRQEKNLPFDPVMAYVESGYQQQIEKERF
ncbi:L-rhamnose isomerase [candidate division KSB1 bacterium]|nr:L-rhamnose isomerase [candidate division KSB1 bacterium]